MSVLKPLGREIAEIQDKLRAESTVVADARAEFLRRTTQGVYKAPLGMGHRPRFAFQAGIAAAAACAVVVMALMLFVQNQPFTVRIGEQGQSIKPGQWVAAPAREDLPLRFSNGSTVSLSPSSKARILELERSQVRVFLETGSAEVMVVHDEDTQWKIDAGPYQISVTGTRFRVAWEPDEQKLALDLHQGSVSVNGPMLDQGRDVVAGESLRVWASTGRLELASLDHFREMAASRGMSEKIDDELDSPPLSAPLLEETVGESETAGQTATGSKAAKHTPPSQRARDESEKNRVLAEPSEIVDRWQSLARGGDYHRAFEEATKVGLQRLLTTGRAQELLLLGDIARLSGKREEAKQSYLQLRKRYAGSELAATAALSLGRIEFDQEHDYKESISWFEVYLEEAENQRLFREVLGRLIEARSKLGDREGAKKDAKQYLIKYPNGPHAQMARNLLGADDKPL